MRAASPPATATSTTASETIVFSRGDSNKYLTDLINFFSRLSDQVEFKLPKKFDDGFNIAVINESVTEEDEVAPSPQKKLQNMPTLDKSSAAGAGPNKKAGKFQKKTLTPSPLTLTPQDKRVEEDERRVEAEKEKTSTKQATSPSAATASKQGLCS